MSFGRRSFLRLAAGAAAAPALPQFTGAVDYPTRPVKVVIGFAPGGPADIVSRLRSSQTSRWTDRRRPTGRPRWRNRK